MFSNAFFTAKNHCSQNKFLEKKHSLPIFLFKNDMKQSFTILKFPRNKIVAKWSAFAPILAFPLATHGECWVPWGRRERPDRRDDSRPAVDASQTSAWHVPGTSTVNRYPTTPIVIVNRAVPLLKKILETLLSCLCFITSLLSLDC